MRRFSILSLGSFGVSVKCLFCCLSDAFVDPKGVPWSLLGVIWGPLGDFLGSLDVLLAAVGPLGGPLGIPGVSWDVPGRLWCDFRDFPGNSGRPFGSIWISFSMFFRAFVGLCFFTIFGAILH